MGAARGEEARRVASSGSPATSEFLRTTLASSAAFGLRLRDTVQYHVSDLNPDVVSALRTNEMELVQVHRLGECFVESNLPSPTG